MGRLALLDRPQAELRSRPGHRAGVAPADRVLELQRSAGNRAVTQLIQRYPKLPTPSDPTQFLNPPSGPFEGSVSRDPYSKQPAALKRVLDASVKDPALWWIQLEASTRLAISMIYNRFQKLGLWHFASRIRNTERATPPIWCGFHVQGDTPSILFEGDAEGLQKTLLEHPKMCHDTKIGALLHKGQSSHREITESDSLHISVGTPGAVKGGFSTEGRRYFDAHIDRYASPRGKKGFFCEYDPSRSVQHLGNEVLPGMAGKKRGNWPRVPIHVFPDAPPQGPRPEMFERHERDKAPPNIIGIGFDF
jgi:hypothetical protein